MTLIRESSVERQLGDWPFGEGELATNKVEPALAHELAKAGLSPAEVRAAASANIISWLRKTAALSRSVQASTSVAIVQRHGQLPSGSRPEIRHSATS